jgi:AP-2 complex subunit alpha
LESMTRILVLPEADEALSEQLRAIIESLSDKDVSIRRRSLDLLYLMCNYNNVGKIVEEMLNFSEETDMQIKEELVLKIAILSEKFAPNLTWYIDVIIRLLSKSGDYITDDIWWRVIQIITGNFLVFKKLGFGNENNQTLQKYAASSL